MASTILHIHCTGLALDCRRGERKREEGEGEIREEGESGREMETKGELYNLIITRTSSVSPYSIHYFTHPLDRAGTGSQDVRN